MASLVEFVATLEASVSLPRGLPSLSAASSAVLGAMLPRGIPLRRLAPVSRRIRRTGPSRLAQLDTRLFGLLLTPILFLLYYRRGAEGR